VYSLDVLQVLVTAGGDKILRIWNPTTGNLLRTIGGLQSPPYAVAIDSENIFAGLSDGYLISWALSTLSQRWAQEPAHDGGIFSMEIKDGKLFTGSLDSEMAVWDLGSGNLLVRQNGIDFIFRSSF
jgi:WD40 repeat protein